MSDVRLLQDLLIHKIKSGNVEEVEKILIQNEKLLQNQSGFSEFVNIDDFTYILEGGSPLHVAVLYSTPTIDQENRQKLIALLLGNGCDVNAKSTLGDTPLHCAASLGNVAVLKQLIDQGAKIEEEDENGCTPLHYAAMFGQADAIEALIKHGANVQAKNNKNANPLHLAVKFKNKNSEKIAKSLIDHGVKLDERDANDETVLDIARRKDQGLADSLKSHADLYNDFFNAITKGDTSKVKDILQNNHSLIHAIGGNLKQGKYDIANTSPLHLAAICGQAEIVDLILNAGLEVNAQDQFGNTALTYAAFFGHPKVFEKLIARNASPTIKTKANVSVLHSAAAYKGNDTIIEYLIKNGCNINEKSENGLTPLHWACSSGNLAAAKKLIELGADVRIKDDFGRLPINRAATKGHRAIIKLLHDKEPTISIYQEMQAPSMGMFSKDLNKKMSIQELIKEGRHLMKQLKYLDAHMIFQKALKQIDPSIKSQANLKIKLQMYSNKSKELAFGADTTYEPEPGVPLDVPAMLMSRVRFGTKLIPSEIYHDVFKKLYADPRLRPILDYVAMDFMMNEKAHIRVVRECESTQSSSDRIIKGFYNTSSTVTVEGRKMDKNSKGVIMHEISHYYFNKAYHFDSNPFTENDPNRAQEFKKVMQQVLINLYLAHDPKVDQIRLSKMSSWEIGKELSEIASLDSPINERILLIYLNYTPDEEVKEFVVRLPDLIARGIDDEALKVLQPLHDYYQTYLLPECEQFNKESAELIADLHKTHSLR